MSLLGTFEHPSAKYSAGSEINPREAKAMVLYFEVLPAAYEVTTSMPKTKEKENFIKAYTTM